MNCRLLLALLLWLPLSALAGPATRPAGHEKLVKDLYGRRIAEAKASADIQDNLELARELMTAAAESGNPLPVRRLLVVEAVRLTAPVGTVDSTRIARAALRMADELGALSPTEKHRLGLGIARHRYDTARRANTPAKLLAPMAAEVVKAQLALVGALLDQKQLDQAESGLSEARQMARVHKIEEYQDRFEAAHARAKSLRDLLSRIRRAEAALAYAREQGDEARIKAAKKDLALIYLLTDGDIPKAGTWLTGTGHPDEAAVSAAAAFLNDRKAIPPAQRCNEVVERLCGLAEQAGNERARAAIGSAAANMCRGFLQTGPKGLPATKARLLLTRAERLAGESPDDRFLRLLKTAYRGLAGRIEVLPGKGVRASYDFSDAAQLGDWAVREGPWKVSASKQILLTAPPRRGRSRIASRLRFRADKPMTFRYQVSGRQQLAGMICFRQHNDPRRSPHEVKFELGAHGNRGLGLWEGGRQAWYNAKVRVARNSIYRVEVTWDGRKTFTWTVNKKLLRQHETGYDTKRLPNASAYVVLEARNYPAGFDDVAVEGVIIENPSQRLQPPGKGR